jgi:diaminopimelate epimerase
MHAFLMNGAGNAFLVLDVRAHADFGGLGEDQARQLAQAYAFDQLLIIENSDTGDAFMRVLNADGSQSGACGNGARCVAWLIMRETGATALTLDSAGGRLPATATGEMRVCVDLGLARTDWCAIPLSRKLDTKALPISVDTGKGFLENPGAVSMGNPHCVFIVADAETIPARAIGHRVEHDPLFPERANIGFAQVIDETNIRLRVWERGAGLTKACGTGAAAALVTTARKGLTGRKATIIADGGKLLAEWRDDDHVTVEGPVELTGEIEVTL